MEAIKMENEKEVYYKDLIYHLYHDFYYDKLENELSEYYEIYDIKEVYYPYYSVQVEYQRNEKKELHPIIFSILNIIEKLGTYRDINILDKLKEITCMDKDILDSILADLVKNGYILISPDLQITKKGKDVIINAGDNIKENSIAYVKIDGIRGEGIDTDLEKNSFDTKIFPKKDKYELKPKLLVFPRTESLSEYLVENKTLKTILYESINKKDTYIWDITSIKITRKFFEKYYCVFYKSKSDEDKQKILILDNKYETDIENTSKFNKLLRDNVISIASEKSEAYKDNIKKLKEKEVIKIEEIKIDESVLIKSEEHPKYFRYVLDNSKRSIFINSPWINNRVLGKYKENIEKALERKVKIFISYGMKKRSKSDKEPIDKEALIYLHELKNKYKDLFTLKETNDHSKILISDDNFAIVGSFNWLSYGGDGGRRETSSININKEYIAQLKKLYFF